MAEDWQKLADEWEGHPIGLVAEVDCTSDGGKPVCEDFEVEVRTCTDGSLLSHLLEEWMKEECCFAVYVHTRFSLY
jgi:hypothetical protein